MAAEDTWLHEIARWKLEAADEDTARYFFTVRGTTSLQDGTNHYVIGRKGSGKTAVAEHIRGLRGPKVRVSSLSFKDFPFPELYRLADSSFSRPSQYTTVWKFIIYSAVCAMMGESEGVDPLIRSQLTKHLSLGIEGALARSLLKLTDAGAGFTILGSGANATAKSVVVPNDAPLSQRVDALEKIIHSHVDQSTYYILFDEIDEDFKDVFDVDASSVYFDLLIGLFKSVQSVKRTFAKSAKIRPIVFLRDDIYDLMRDNDKNKWRDTALSLNWTAGELQKLTAFRLGRAQVESSPRLTFEEAFKRFFTNDETRAGGRSTKRHVFQYIAARTLMRPRDFISYIRECAKLALDAGSPKVTAEQLVEANRGYSIRLREEFVDEMQSSVSYINEVFEVLSGIRKQVFSFQEFEVAYRNYTVGMPENRIIPFEAVCKLLFHYGAIGNQASQRSNVIFRSTYPEAKVNFAEPGVIHPGLLRSLQIK